METVEAKGVDVIEKVSFAERLTTFWRGFSKNKTAVVGLVIVTFMVIVAMLAPFVIPYDPVEPNYSNRLGGPSAENWMGTDEMGRDIFSRVLMGARVSMTISIGAVFTSVVVGIVIGLLAGYFGGWIDHVFMRVVDGLMSFPSILFAIALMAVLGPKTVNIILALSVVYAPLFARVVRSSVLSVKEKEYIQAIKVLGGSHLRIIFKHVLPNCMSPLLIQMTTYFAYAILAEASLSFVGLGVPAPHPSWGNILYDGRAYMFEAPWITIFPGVAIGITVLGLNLFGDGLRDYLDPRMK